jgi:hypothetical protein
MGVAYSVDLRPELARNWSALSQSLSFRFLSCLFVIDASRLASLPHVFKNLPLQL